MKMCLMLDWILRWTWERVYWMSDLDRWMALEGGGGDSNPQGSLKDPQKSFRCWDRRWIEIGLRIHRRLKNLLSIRNEVAEFIRVGFDSRNLKDPEESLGSQKDPEESSKISRTFKYSKVSSTFFKALQRILQDLQGSLKKSLQNPSTSQKDPAESSDFWKISTRF